METEGVEWARMVLYVIAWTDSKVNFAKTRLIIVRAAHAGRADALANRQTLSVFAIQATRARDAMKRPIIVRMFLVNTDFVRRC